MKSEERKKEDCELLDALQEQMSLLAPSLKKDLMLKECFAKFKADNDLLPKNVSGWYLSRKYKEWVVYYDFEKNIIYGIDLDNDWFLNQIGNDGNIDPDDYPATQQQVEERLFPFFEKMYPKGSRAKCLYYNLFEDINDELNPCRDNNVWIGGTCIMKDGILAEFIEESEVDKLKAEIRKLSDKLKELGE